MRSRDFCYYRSFQVHASAALEVLKMQRSGALTLSQAVLRHTTSLMDVILIVLGSATVALFAQLTIPIQPVPMTTWLGVMILAASVLWTRWDDDETAIVAAVATTQPVCYLASSVQAQPTADGALLTGLINGTAACNIWAVIQDPRTGTLWLQGPASLDGSSWSLALSLATSEDGSDHLPYLVSVAVVDDDTHDGWVAQTLAEGMISIESTSANGWLARDVPV